MTKKILAIIMAALLVAALAACANETGDEETTDDGKIDIESTAGTGEDTTEPDETGSEVGDYDDRAPGEHDYVAKTGKVYILHENGAVNLRNADGTVFKSFDNGTEFDRIAVSSNGEWTKVVYEGTDYYVVSACLTDLADLDEGFVAVSKTLKLATGGLNIRIAPSMGNRVVGVYSEGDEVKVIAENTSTGWYKVEFTAYGGATAYGYVASDDKYYAEVEGATTAEDTTEAATESNTESTDK